MKNFLFLLLLSITVFSCSKENSDSFFPYPNNPANDTAWLPQVPANSEGMRLMESLTRAPYVDSFNGSNGAMLRLPNFVEVQIPPLSLKYPNGIICSTNVKIGVIALRSKGDMVRFSKPTTSYGRLLETGGAFFIHATSNGQELSLANQQAIRIKYRMPTINARMEVFYGIQNLTPPFPPGTNPAFTWAPATDSSFVSTFQQQDSSGAIIRGYELFSQRLRWVNADYFIDTTRARTRIDVILPPNYTNVNTNVFAVFNNENIVVQLNSEFATRSFYTINIPVATQVTIVSLSKLGDILYLGSKQITTTANQPVQLQPEIKTKPQIEQYLQSL